MLIKVKKEKVYQKFSRLYFCVISKKIKYFYNKIYMIFIGTVPYLYIFFIYGTFAWNKK